MEVLNKIYEDSKQEQALKQIQQEMKSELMQQKQAMDRQLQEAMKNELEVCRSTHKQTTYPNLILTSKHS